MFQFPLTNKNEQVITALFAKCIPCCINLAKTRGSLTVRWPPLTEFISHSEGHLWNIYIPGVRKGLSWGLCLWLGFSEASLLMGTKTPHLEFSGILNTPCSIFHFQSQILFVNFMTASLALCLGIFLAIFIIVLLSFLLQLNLLFPFHFSHSNHPVFISHINLYLC